MTAAPRTIADHVAATRARVAPLEAVDVALTDVGPALGLVLARDAVAATAVPAFDHSAMDGYAVRLADLPDDGSTVTLPVLGDVRPGPATPPTVVGGDSSTPRGAVRIMTGAPVPPGYDAVVPVERTSTGRFVAGAPSTEATVTLSRQHRTHIRHAAEDVRPGELLAPAGTTLSPGIVAVAAAAGLRTVTVHRRPVVAVLSTGSELADLGTRTPGTIPDSNSVMLAALARSAGADVVRTGAVPDDAGALHDALDDVAGRVDLLVTSGGVSAGASDVVREVLAAGVAADVDVAAVAMRPGRPQALATWRGTPWVAVPGNPVSAHVSFTLFARAAIRRLAGAAAEQPGTARATVSWTSPAGAEQVLPVVTGPDGVTPAARDGHHLTALATADALALVPADVEQVTAGDTVTVLPLEVPR